MASWPGEHGQGKGCGCGTTARGGLDARRCQAAAAVKRGSSRYKGYCAATSKVSVWCEESGLRWWQSCSVARRTLCLGPQDRACAPPERRMLVASLQEGTRGYVRSAPAPAPLAATLGRYCWALRGQPITPVLSSCKYEPIGFYAFWVRSMRSRQPRRASGESGSPCNWSVMRTSCVTPQNGTGR